MLDLQRRLKAGGAGWEDPGHCKSHVIGQSEHHGVMEAIAYLGLRSLSHRIHGAGIYANIGGILMVNVTITHGSYGYRSQFVPLEFLSSWKNGSVSSIVNPALCHRTWPLGNAGNINRTIKMVNFPSYRLYPLVI